MAIASSPALEAAAARVLSALTSDDALVAALEGVLRELATAEVVTAKVALERIGVFGKVWRALRPAAERLKLTSTLDELGSAAGLSTRQVERTIDRFLDTFDIADTGWRSATRHLRDEA